jgi:hypothetical protein
MRGLNSDLGLGDLEAAVRSMGWSDERAKWEVENYRDEIKAYRISGLDRIIRI